MTYLVISSSTRSAAKFKVKLLIFQLCVLFQIAYLSKLMFRYQNIQMYPRSRGDKKLKKKNISIECLCVIFVSLFASRNEFNLLKE